MNFDLLEEHNKIEDFKNNISIKNLNDFIFNNKSFTDLHNFDFNAINKDVFKKYIELFISPIAVEETYYFQLQNNIHYFNEDYLIATEKINEIDSSFYNTNKIKEYLFMTNFLSDFYKSKYKNKNEYNLNNNSDKKILFNLKYNYDEIGNIYSIYDLNKTIKYVPIKFNLGNNAQINNNSSIIKNININNLDEYVFVDHEISNYISTFNKLFNIIKFENINELNKNIDYYNSVFLSYKYTYYNILLNYNTIQLYYIYIKINGKHEDSNLVKYQEIYELLEIFEKVFLNHELKFNQLNIIMNSVDKLDYKAESEKIEEAKKSINKLQNINKNLLKNQDYIKNNYKKIEVTQKDIETNRNKIIVISLLMILTFLTFGITINYYSLDTSKFLSLIVIFIIVNVILVNNYIIKNKTYENFEELVPIIEDTNENKTTSELLAILESEDGTLSDAYDKMSELNNKYESAKSASYTSIEQGADLSNEEIDIDAIDLNYKGDENFHALRIQSIQRAYIQHTGNENSALNNNIDALNTRLDMLNDEYSAIKDEESILIGIKATMDDNIEALKLKLVDANTQLTARWQMIDDMGELLTEYNELNDELSAIMVRKERIKDLKIEKIEEINKININLLDVIEEKTKISTNNESDIKELELVLGDLIFEIDYLSKEKKNYEDRSVIEDALIIELHSDIAIRTASYYKVLNTVNKQQAKIANLKEMIENEDMEIQKWAKRIVALENTNRVRAQISQEYAIKATEEAEKALNILKNKIEQIKEDIKNKPKPISYNIKLKLDFIIAGESNTTKRYNFENQLMSELSKLLLVPLNRFRINNISNGSINIIIIFYPSRTYDNRDLSNKDLISKLEDIFLHDEVNEKLLNTKYLKFAEEIAEVDSSNNVIDINTIKILNTSKYLNTTNIISKINNIFEKNSLIIKNIGNFVNQLDNTKSNPNTYYNEINPSLNLEVKNYSEKNLRIDNDTNILESKTDILVHDYINSSYIYNYLSYITLLLSFVFLSYSYLNNYVLIIYIIALIIFIIIIFNLYMDIYKNVRRKSKKQYWGETNNI